jgi:hypothetical protein
MPHTVSRQLLTAEAKVRFRATPGEVCGPRGNGAGSPTSTSGSPFQNHANNAPHSFSSKEAPPGKTGALSQRSHPLRSSATHSVLCPQSICVLLVTQAAPPLHTHKAKLLVPVEHDATPMRNRLQTSRGNAALSSADLGHLQTLKYTKLSRNVGNVNYQLTQSHIAEERSISTQRC